MKHAVLFSLLGALALTGPACADDWAVSAIKYKNKGAYDAFFGFYYKFATNGAVVGCDGKNTRKSGLSSGDDITLQLDNSDNSLVDPECLPRIGDEVWGMVYIDRGFGFSQAMNTQSCRKDGAKFYYHPDGGTVVVQTKGTTENNNRCRINQKGEVKYPPPE
ncbi:MAG: hypothetical protein AAFO74_01000 [Pseudomonadota bacterium]